METSLLLLNSIRGSNLLKLYLNGVSRSDEALNFRLRDILLLLGIFSWSMFRSFGGTWLPLSYRNINLVSILLLFNWHCRFANLLEDRSIFRFLFIFFTIFFWLSFCLLKTCLRNLGTKLPFLLLYDFYVVRSLVISCRLRISNWLDLFNIVFVYFGSLWQNFIFFYCYWFLNKVIVSLFIAILLWFNFIDIR